MHWHDPHRLICISLGKWCGCPSAVSISLWIIALQPENIWLGITSPSLSHVAAFTWGMRYMKKEIATLQQSNGQIYIEIRNFWSMWRIDLILLVNWLFVFHLTLCVCVCKCLGEKKKSVGRFVCQNLINKKAACLFLRTLILHSNGFK